ncbi:FAD-binding protein [Rhodococcus ruber]|nr:FAD-binding protein [Rhodococcus ruber]
MTDFLVIGSGAGLVGAAAAGAAGLDVLVIEKSEFIGGSTGISGGVFWLPANPLMARDNVPDSVAAGLEYLSSVVGDVGPASSDARRSAYVTTGVEMIRFLEREGMSFVRCDGYSDYYADVRGYKGGLARGRSIECVPTDRRQLGALDAKVRPSIAGPLALRTGEAAPVSMIRVSLRAMLLAARVGLRTTVGRLRGQHLTTNGAAMITQLLQILVRREIPIWTRSSFVDLLEEDGAVVGAVIKRNGRQIRVRARRGVLLAAGGFAHNAEMRRKYSGDLPNEALWTSANPGDTGEVLQAAIEHGAATDMLDAAWWMPTFFGPDSTPYMVNNTRCQPGAVIVDAAGRRYFNEAASYIEAGYAMYEQENKHGTGLSSWLILDSRHRSRYMLGNLPPGRTPKEWVTSGVLKRSDTLAGLAEQCGMDGATLASTMERFNELAATGVDEDFHRGEGAHERYQGDPTNRPNPCLAPLVKPPFYAIRLVPGDIGTAGGMLCDEYSRALNSDGEPIPGLYAAGNITASVMGRTNPGAGASIGASAVFSYIAANDAANRVHPVARVTAAND